MIIRFRIIVNGKLMVIIFICGVVWLIILNDKFIINNVIMDGNVIKIVSVNI